MTRIYESREKWAKPYSNDKFCARMMSTPRVESANHMLKAYVPRNSSMNRFVLQYNNLLFDRCAEEDREEHLTKQVKDCIMLVPSARTHSWFGNDAKTANIFFS
jgi:disulfide oxidoreductase YuzD